MGIRGGTSCEPAFASQSWLALGWDSGLPYIGGGGVGVMVDQEGWIMLLLLAIEDALVWSPNPLAFGM